MPLSDWREGLDHADAGWGSIHDIGYLKANIAGGEGFDWFYDGPEGEAAQLRKPIQDGEFGEDWVYRYKDLRGWWGNQHHNRIGGVRAVAPTAWVPGSKPIRFTEFGCAAVDKGANQPNRFLDLKSSESGLPKYSTGARDDLMQMAYHQAMQEFWTDPANNPVSITYGGPMVDFARSTAWAWDARPFPAFPAMESLWSDGTNYDAGHWLNGRVGNQSLAAVIGELCEASGVKSADLTAADGVVRGYALREVGAARAALQPLLLAEGVDAVEREGRLHFRKRKPGHPVVLDPAGLALAEEVEGSLELTRSGLFDRQDRIRLSFPEAEGDFSVRTVDAVSPDAITDAVSESELPMLLTRAEAISVAERWLAEARVARDGARFVLPPSLAEVGAGDVVSLSGKSYRIDRIEQSGLQIAEAVRVEPAVYQRAEVERVARKAVPFLAPLPVFPLFLDLPLLTGTEAPHAPHLAVSAKPWPGTVGLWSSVSDDGYALNTRAEQPAVIGRTLNALAAAPAGRWDRGPALQVLLESGSLSSASDPAVFAGANAVAIGDGSSGTWEVFQFTEALLTAPKTYELSKRLRGQAGTDGGMPAEWPAGSLVVLLDAALRQIDLPLSARGLARHYRIAPLDRGYQAGDAVQRVESFDGIGLRPYPVAHLRAKGQPGAEIALQWVRRTRIDGDSWQSVEVPLGEESEAYRIRVLSGAAVLRETIVATPGWSYTAAMQLADTPSGPVTLEVSQVSQRFGPGPARGVVLAF